MYSSWTSSFTRLDFFCDASIVLMNCGIPSASAHSVSVSCGILAALIAWKPEKNSVWWYKEFEVRDIHIERVKVLELLVPRLVDNFHDEVFAL